MGSKAKTLHKEQLVNIKQGKSESLRSYLTKFNKIVHGGRKISNDTILMAVLSRLRPITRF